MYRTTLAVILAGTIVLAGYDAIAKKRAGVCPGSLGTTVFRCAVKGEDGTSFDDCFRFGGGGQVSAKFEFSSDRLGTRVGCTCQPSGRPGKPIFGGAADFSCASDLGVGFVGRVKRNGTITKGAVTNAQGGSYAFQCTRDEACALQ